MDTEYLKSKIFELTKNDNIFIEENQRELKIWASTSGSEIYSIYLGIWKDKSFVTIRNYEIDFYLRGKGIGSKFYDIFEEYIKLCGYKEIYLHCVLTSAEKFWKKKGYMIQNRFGRKLLNI
jgi:hypothetical protein